MDSFTQAAAYLQTPLEYAAKIGSIIPLWMLLVVMDKHLLGLPLFEGSFWHSPRIPPQFTIKGRHGVKHTSSSNFSQRSTGNGSGGPVPEDVAPFGPSLIERGSAEFTTPCHQPSNLLHHCHDSLPVLASDSTVLSIHQPLEVHDPFNPSSQWLEPGFVGCAVLLVLVLALLRIIACGRWFPFGNNEAKQSRKTNNIETPSNDALGQQSLAEKTESCWESTVEKLGLGHSGMFSEDYLEQLRMPTTQIPSEVGQHSIPIQVEGGPSMQTQSSTPATPSPPQRLSFPAVASGQTPPSIPAPHISSLPPNVAIGRVPSAPTVHATSVGTVPSPSPTLHRTPVESAEGSREESGGSCETTDFVIGDVVVSKKGEDGSNEGLDEVAAMGEEKPKKKKIRQNAKRREAKRVAAEEARQAKEARQAEEALQAEEVRQLQKACQEEEARQEEEGMIKAGEVHNAFPQDIEESEEGAGKADEVEPQASDLPNTGLGGTLDAVKKKPRRRQKKRKSKVKDHPGNDIDHEPDNLVGSR